MKHTVLNNILSVSKNIEQSYRMYIKQPYINFLNIHISNGAQFLKLFKTQFLYLSTSLKYPLMHLFLAAKFRKTTLKQNML